MFVVVSSMVGGGVLTTSGFTVGETQSNALMLALWAFGGLVALCGALTLGELSAALPRAGGEYAILAEAYGPRAAFLSGWVSLVPGFAAPIAATGSAAADYLLTPLELPDPLVSKGVASALILGFAAIHATGRDRAARVQTAITLAIIIMLIVFVAAGLIAGWPHRINLVDWPGLDQVSPGTSVFPLIYVAYSYTGWNAAAHLGGEVDDPKRLPVAIVAGTTLVVVLYLGMNTVYALALPAREVVALQQAGGPRAVERIAELAAGRLFPPGWSARLSVGGGLVLLGSLSAMLLTGPRVIYAMALAGQFPSAAARLSGKGRTPALATAWLAAIALSLLWIGGFEPLVVFSGVGLALFSMLTVGSVYVLRRTRPDLPRPFRTPFYPTVPAIYLMATSALVAAAFARRPMESGLALASILIGLPIYALGPGRSTRHA